MERLNQFVTDEENRRIFLMQLTFTCFAAILNFVAFVAPFWIEAKSGAYALFNRIGLWTVCFDGYMRPNQYSKAYFGCYYIYYVEYDAIRDWINPIWLYVVQALSSIGLICHALVVFVLLCQLTGRMRIEALVTTKWLMAGSLISGVAMLSTISGFTYGSLDSRWVPYPKFNRLSWSFGIAVFSLFLTICAFFTFLVFYLKVNMKLSDRSTLLNSENGYGGEEADDEVQKLAHRIYTEPDTLHLPSGLNYSSVRVSQNVGRTGVREYLGDNDDHEFGSFHPYPTDVRI